MDRRRHRTIAEMLRQRLFLSMNDIVRIIGGSPATVRRGTDKFVVAGLGQKVRGGIAATPTTAREPSAALPHIEKRDLAVEVKNAIARASASLVLVGSAIIIHSGSISFHFSAEVADRNLRIFAQSLLITDDGLSAMDARMLENEGVDCLIAKTKGGCAS